MRQRCDWCTGDPVMEAYHDDEWGVPRPNDNSLFELLILEIFQAGLSWKTILYRREGFRRAFADFDVAKVAEFDDRDFERLIQDAGIIRNRLKIEATLANAKTVRDLQREHGSFQAWLDSLPAGDLDSYQKTFRKTFRFCGPEITRMFVMGCGLVDAPHEETCWRFRK